MNRIIEWFKDQPSLHRHEVTELQERYIDHKELGFHWVTVIYTWWCPICKRSWKRWGYLNSQCRQIHKHVEKLRKVG